MNDDLHEDWLCGLEKWLAIDVLKKEGRRYRITKEDGRHGICTCDLDMERFNLEIENGIVVRAQRG